MPSCVVKWCRSHTDMKNSGITFHIFPKNYVQRKKWITAVRLERNEFDWMPSEFSKICSIHFSSDDIYICNNGKLKRLKKTAVPICTMVSSNADRSSHLCGSSTIKNGTNIDVQIDTSSIVHQSSLPPDSSDGDSTTSDEDVDPISESDTESKMEVDTQPPNEKPQTSGGDQPCIPMLEVCIDSLESAINAIHGGAEELEVCSSLTEGGLTPSAGLVKKIVKMVRHFCSSSKIRKACVDCGCDKLTMRPKVNVMIRCRAGSDFCYSEEEMDTMLCDLKIFKAYGVDRFVFGALTDTQDIDEINCKKIIHNAYPIPVTFHRAFDVCSEPLTAINKIHALGFNRLLTSGQKPSAEDPEAIDLIKTLLNLNDKVQIMPGAGINCNNVNTFIGMGCQIVHSSCKRIRYLPEISNAINMGSSDSECVFVSDEGIVRIMKKIISTSCIKQEENISTSCIKEEEIISTSCIKQEENISTIFIKEEEIISPSCIKQEVVDI